MIESGSSGSAQDPALSLLDNFLEQVRRAPQSLAVQDPQRAWTYAELLEQCLAVAGVLAARTDVQHRRVLLFAGKNCHAAAGILGSLLAGWRYACVDEAYPIALVEGVCRAIAPDLVLIANEDGAFATKTIQSIGSSWPSYDLADLGKPRARSPTELPLLESLTPGRGEDIAYLGFTSGSTGVPKVVAMSHRGFHDSVHRHIADFGFNHRDRVGIQSCFGFDPAVMDLLSAVWVGGTAVMVPSECYRDGMAWNAYLQRQRITSLHCIPGTLGIAFDTLALGQTFAPSLRRLILTGDTVHPYLLRLLARRLPQNTRVYNAYGLTEAPYILNGAIDVDDPASANRFRWPEPIRDIHFDPSTDSNNDREPGALRLRVGGPILFSGYLVTPDRLHLPYDTGGLFDVGDLFSGDEHWVRYRGRGDRRLNWWGYRIEPEEIERALCSDERIFSARLEVDEAGELVCGLASDHGLEDLETGVRERLRETSIGGNVHWVRLVGKTLVQGNEQYYPKRKGNEHGK